MEFSTNVLPSDNQEWTFTGASMTETELNIGAGGNAKTYVYSVDDTNQTPTYIRIELVASTYGEIYNPPTFVRVEFEYNDGSSFALCSPVIDNSNGAMCVEIPVKTEMAESTSSFSRLTFSILSSINVKITGLSLKVAVSNIVTEGTSYYGAKFSKHSGLEIERLDGNARVVFNADKMAFYQGNEEILYFDPKAKKWKMTSSVEVHVPGEGGADTTIDVLTNGILKKITDAEGKYIAIEETLDGLLITTQEGETLIDGGMIVTDNMQLHRLIAKGSPNSYVEMLTNGLNFVLGNANTIGIGYNSASIPQPYIIFGEGVATSSSELGMIKYYPDGIWIGNSADRHSAKITYGTGLFVDTTKNIVYSCTDGVMTQIGTMSDISSCLAASKRYTDDRLESFAPIAVFG